MINMFKIIDDTYINLCNRVHNTHASVAWITQIQTQLSEAVPAYFDCTEVQEVLIRITQQWLRSQTWQLSVCQGLVSSVSNDISLTFKYPIEIARDLLTISHQFSQQAMEMQGVGLVSIFPIFPSIFPHHHPSTLEIVTARAPPSLCWNNPCRIRSR
jgi:hypothetical protein